MPGRQTQGAGDNAQQLQIAGDAYFLQGVTEARAEEIALAAAKSVLAEYAEEAHDIAFERLLGFDKKVVNKLAQSNRLSAFRDPAFILLLKKAQLGATATGKESDHDLLAQLLDERAGRDEQPVAAAISRAVEVVDLLNDVALAGLTVAQAVYWVPQTGFILQGLDVLDNVFEDLLKLQLPTDTEWLDHLDTLRAVRTSSRGVFSLKKMSELYAISMPGYMSAGADAETDNTHRLTLEALGFPLTTVPHELKQGYFRVPIVAEEPLRNAIEAAVPDDADRRRRISEIVFEGYNIGKSDPECLKALSAEIDRRPSLQKARQWWDNLPFAFDITAIGRVLAYANARNCVRSSLLPSSYS